MNDLNIQSSSSLPSVDPVRSKKLVRKPQDFSKVLIQEEARKAAMKGYDDDVDEEEVDNLSRNYETNSSVNQDDDVDLKDAVSGNGHIDCVPQALNDPSTSLKASPKSSHSSPRNSPSTSLSISLPPISESNLVSKNPILILPTTQLKPVINNSLQIPSSYLAFSSDLPAKDSHYINKALACLEIKRQFSSLSNVGALSYYGSPFLPHSNGPNSRPRTEKEESKGMLSWMSRNKPLVIKEGWEDYEWKREENGSPILSFLFERFVKTLPALRMAKDEYWTDQIQPFIDSFAERDLSTSQERDEITKRHLLSLGISRLVSDFYSTVITADGNSEPVRPNRKIMNRVDDLFPGSMKGMWKREFEGKVGYNVWTAVVDCEEVEVEKTYSIVSQVLVGKLHPRYLVKRTFDQTRKLFSSIHQLDSANLLQLPFSSNYFDDAIESIQFRLRTLIIALSTPSSVTIGTSTLQQARTLLEVYLTASSKDVSEEKLDKLFEIAERIESKAEKDHLQWIAFGGKGKDLRSTWATYKNALIEGDEIDRSIALVKRIPKIVDLPTNYQVAERRACIWVAYALHYVFVESANGPELLHIVKSLHDLTPYAAMKLGLSLVNPTLAIRAIVALLLGQPAGTPSLFQRMFSIVIGGGIKHQKKIIHRLRKEFDHDSIYLALHNHVYASFTMRTEVRSEAKTKGSEDILLTIIRKYGSLLDMESIHSWQNAFLQLQRGQNLSTEDEKKLKKHSDLFSTCKELLRAILKKRDREQVLAIIMEENTPILMRSTITVFYEAIYKIADACKLADRLGDYQRFIDDLLIVCAGENNEPSDFINLTSRHSQSLYYWIHEMAFNGGTLLQPAIDWCKVALSCIKDGIATPSSSSPSSLPSNPRTTTTTTTGSAPRASIPIRSLLDSLTSTTTLTSPFKSNLQHSSNKNKVDKQKILQESRELQFFILYKKVESDINLRLDLIAAATSSVEERETEGGIRVTKEGRSNLLARVVKEDENFHQSLIISPSSSPKPLNPNTSELKREDDEEEEGGEEGGVKENKLSWAWFADEEIINLSNNRIDSEGKKIIFDADTSTSSLSTSTLRQKRKGRAEVFELRVPRLNEIRKLSSGFEMITRGLLERENEMIGSEEGKDVD